MGVSKLLIAALILIAMITSSNVECLPKYTMYEIK